MGLAGNTGGSAGVWVVWEDTTLFVVGLCLDEGSVVSISREDQRQLLVLVVVFDGVTGRSKRLSKNIVLIAMSLISPCADKYWGRTAVAQPLNALSHVPLAPRLFDATMTLLATTTTTSSGGVRWPRL